MNILEVLGTAFTLLIVTWQVSAHCPFMARLTRRNSIPIRPYTPTVSVLIATRDDVPLIGCKVDSIPASDYPADRLQIVVAFDWSTYRQIPTLRNAADARIAAVLGDGPGGKAAP
jgi:cellulose synthase/poly-beta-1,6-N-acetylglucosamine synthase-like glycosyltransferase